MRYSRFEKISLLVLAVVVFGMSLAMIYRQIDVVEVVGHLLMLVIIAASLHWGAKGAVPTLLASLSVYIPLRLTSGNLTAGAEAQLIIAKTAIYLILAGICSFLHLRFRYLFIKAGHHDLFDEETEMGNERFLLNELNSRIQEYDRYEVPFSLVIFGLERGGIDKLARERKVNALRDISISILKVDTRSVDELARVENRLVVVLPSIRRNGAEMCAERLGGKIRKYLEESLEEGKPEGAISVEIYEYPDDKQSIQSLVDQLQAMVHR